MKYLSVLLGDRDARDRERTVVRSFFFKKKMFVRNRGGYDLDKCPVNLAGQP